MTLGREIAQDLLGQVCAAVEFAHRNGIIHRDLKPGNIMIEPSGKPWVMDFGLAREMANALSHLTTTAIIGTPAYMAPEQHLGKVCGQSDVYALGVTFYEMVVGKRPFSGISPFGIKELLPFDKASTLVPGLPSELDDLVAKCLDPDPGKRPRSPAEFADLLMRIPEA